MQPQKKRNPHVKPVSFLKLFRFAGAVEKILMLIGYLAAAGNGVLMPLSTLIFGDLTNTFSPLTPPDEMVSEAGKSSLKLLGFALGQLVLGYISFAASIVVGERMATAFRRAYFKSLIKQEIAFFDSINPNELSTSIAQQCSDFQNGVGDKIATLVSSTATVISGFLVGYLKGWQEALVISACIPLIGIAGAIYVYLFQRATHIANAAYAVAGGIAEECLNAIRTVVALCGQEREMERYQESLLKAKAKVVRLIYFAGLAMGGIFCSEMCAYAVGFWYGSRLIKNQTVNPVTDKPYSPGDIITVFFSVLLGAQALSQIPPCLSNLSDAKVAAAEAYQIIDRKSLIDPDDPKGLKPETVEGNIEFKNLVFAYPTKKDKIILNGVSFTIRKNEKTAFVGESGCGKTTSMQLIERFYDFDQGSLTLDGIEIKDLNLKWLRSQIGYVGQEPVLFATTIRQNMLMAKEDATDEEIWQALKNANAEDFVRTLPKGLDTYVGNSGTQLSGGQKQRLAIARAILKNPRILLLDEATSALDRKNEVEIQKTLDEISEGRTTIVIAHRLSTIQNADHIIVFDKGNIVEEGKHEELIAKKGKYYELQRLQLQKEADEEEKEKNTIHQAPKLLDEVNEFETEVHPTGNPFPLLISAPQGLASKRTSSVIEIKEKSEEKTSSKLETKGIVKRLLTYDKSKRGYLLFAIFCTIVSGVVYPIFALIISDMLTTFMSVGREDYDSRSRRGAIYFVICAGVTLISRFLGLGAYGEFSQALSVKLRTALFKKYLNMHMSFFDEPENTPGALCTKITNDCNQIRVLTINVIAVYVQAFASIVAGLVITYVSSWKIGLIATACLPFTLIPSRIQAVYNQKFADMNDRDYEESGSFIAEAANNMRTVASFGREDTLAESYEKKLEGPLSRAVKKGSILGFSFGFSNFAMMGTYCIIFYVCAILIRDEGLDLMHVFKAFFGVMFGFLVVQLISQFAPDVGSAKTAAANIFKTLDVNTLDWDVSETFHCISRIKAIVFLLI